MQYERLFNSCRIPGEDVDQFRIWQDAKHVAVYHNGCWFKVIVHNGKRLLDPSELELQYEAILNSDSAPAPGEVQLFSFISNFYI